MEKQIQRIAAKPKLEKRMRVAAYARVSSGKDAMLHSLVDQVGYYSDLIQGHPGWEFAGVYADEAMTGTKEDRPEFQRLLEDCRNGCIDMVITKAISRFARNTVTVLESVRELKALGVDVYFEDQRIHTMSADGELMLTILGSYAQEESRSASDNQKWRIRKAYERGEIMCWRHMFGYRISKQDGIEIDPVDGPIVQEVFARVAGGESLNSIARWLNRTGHFGALGGKWQGPRLREMLSNEKYLGNALLQKTFVNNHLEKKKLLNTGELPKYYVTETHPALIDQETFDIVQQRLAAIAESHAGKSRQTSEFTGMIRCPNCGRNFRRTLKNGSPGWICPTYCTEGKAYCQSKRIPDDTLKAVIMAALGLDTWLPDVFLNQVTYMVASGPNTVELHMMDGSVRSLDWKGRSRRDSWTPEMKAEAAEHARRRHHG
ncbi:MAG: recombinase family protein [Clostridia bacterium]|nr:recombinase family protein [Clostridia bacterium]